MSIPLTSGNSFLRRIWGTIRRIGSLCQSPSPRGTHFYRHSPRKNQDKLRGVNPLHLGELISTITGQRNSGTSSGVNPLLIGELISTTCLNCGMSIDDIVSIPFSSGNSFLPSPLFFVDFMRLSSLDFRGIFQTILKTAVFSVTSTFLSIFYRRVEYEGHAFL